MTWAVAACNFLGAYAAVVSDIQVSFSDGRAADMLRKAYPVGPYIAGAFAGSVRIGFMLMQSISEYLRVPADVPADMDVCWDPAEIATSWAPIACQVFEAAPTDERELGAQFLLAGPHPQENGMLDRAIPYICKLSWPTFKPEIRRNENSALSIGSGSVEEEYRRGLQEALNPDSGLLHAEMGANPGGWAGMLGFAVNRIAAWHPVSGISSHVHILVAHRGGFTTQTSDMRHHRNDGSITEIRMPPVAESYEQFLEMARELKADAAAAIC